jgi:hypothetical protein
MPGGLIQIAVYGTQDLFLTGEPQITFFKTVYRRYTNFAIESIAQTFTGDIQDFGSRLTCDVEKNADLIHKAYLEFDIPAVTLQKDSSLYLETQAQAQNDVNLIVEFFNIVQSYIQVDTYVTTQLNTMVNITNITMNSIILTMNTPSFIGNLVAARDKLLAFINSPNFLAIQTLSQFQNDFIYQVNRIDIQIMFNMVISDVNDIVAGQGLTTQQIDILQKKAVLNLINNRLYPELQEFYNIIYADKIEKDNTLAKFVNGTYSENFLFAWVKQLGHVLVDNIEVKIGGGQIDKQTGDWLILFNELSLLPDQTRNYDIMIGNVPDMYTFDTLTKPSMKLYVPLQFWFCRHNGLALPLISMRYHDLLINLQIKEFAQCAYVENTVNLPSMDNIQNMYNIHLNSATLYLDYIYLDHFERVRFAQATHEYLIEQIQYNEFQMSSTYTFNGTQQINIPQEDTLQLYFANPCKELIWFCQPNQYRYNVTGKNPCRWSNFGTKPNGSGATTESSYLLINGFARTLNLDQNYYNYVQPWQCHTRTPAEGIHVYSFALIPEKHQPSSACNMSRIASQGLHLKLSNALIQLAESNTDPTIPTGVYVGVYTINYNILRFFNGFAGLAYQISA